jgi:hypothetical protein
MWNETAEKFIVDISNLDDAIVVFCGFKVSAFAWDTGEIFFDKFDDFVIMIKFKLNQISPTTLFSGICFLVVFSFQINPYLPDESELRLWLTENQ